MTSARALPDKGLGGHAENMPLRVAVLGQGYVGLPLAMRAVAVGHDVVGFDRDEVRVKALAEGESFVNDVPSDVLHVRHWQRIAIG